MMNDTRPSDFRYREALPRTLLPGSHVMVIHRLMLQYASMLGNRSETAFGHHADM